VADAFPLQVYSAGITPLSENVVDVMVRLISHSAPCGNSVQEVEPFGMTVELEKGAAQALPWDRRGHPPRLRSDSPNHGESTLPAGQENLCQSQGREKGSGLRLRQAGQEAGGNGCPKREEGYRQTGEACRKDCPPCENAGDKASDAYGVIPSDEETGD